MATLPYATVADLETRLGRDLTSSEQTRATDLLDTVSVYVDLNVGDCVDTIVDAYPTILVDVVAGAVLRQLAKDPERDPSQTQVQLGEASVSYRYERSRGSAAGPLSDDDIATLRKACGLSTARGLGSVPLTTTLHEMTKHSVETYVVNAAEPETLEPIDFSTLVPPYEGP